ncbi:MAG: roadblock/LC7 domain-containing protein [Candidatus Thorarchaeota archaeon]|nr:roadblock/LC7 domain-containing protein [Candidatus Thorarchaeota archaeon]
MSSKTDMLKELLLDLSRASQGNVEASVIISKSQGLPIYSLYPDGVDDKRIPDEDVIAGRSTQIQEATRKVFKQLKRGPLIRMLIEGETGYVIICDAGDDAILVVLTNKRANIGYMFFSMSRTARRIQQVLS